MSDSAELAEAVRESTPPDLDQLLKGLVERTDLIDVRTTKWYAELLSDEPLEGAELNLRITSQSRNTEKGFDIRFNVDAPLVSSSKSEIAAIQVGVVASFSLKGEERPDRVLLKAFIDQVALFVVMPFIRESLHSLSARIGLEPITIGLLHQDKRSPSKAWQPRA